MIEETGVVQKTDGVTATVLVQKRGACEGCTATGTCEMTQDGMVIEALNHVGAKPGQTVSVSIAPISYLKGTMLVYGLPLVALIAGAVLGKNVGDSLFPSYSSDLVAALSGFGAFFTAFLFVKIWSVKAEQKIEHKPMIKAIVNEE